MWAYTIHYNVYFWFAVQALNEATFWFTMVITVIILTIPVLAWRFYFVDVCPTLSDRVRLKQRLAQLRYVVLSSTGKPIAVT